MDRGEGHVSRQRSRGKGPGHIEPCRGFAGKVGCVGKGLDKRNETEAVGWDQAVMDLIHPAKNFGLRAIEWDTFKSGNDMLRSVWQSGEGIVIGEVAGKPIKKQQRFDLPGSCRFPNSLRGDGPGLAGR